MSYCRKYGIINYMIHTFYQKIYEKNAAFYRSRPKAKKALVFGNYALTAVVFFAYAILCPIVLIRSGEKFSTNFLKLIGMPSLCLLFVSLLRKLVNRKRPYESGEIPPVIEKKKKGHSFPSRHAASAFVIGTAALPYCIPAGVAVLIAGALLCYIRFAAGIHYPSDLLTGTAIGILFGLAAFI